MLAALVLAALAPVASGDEAPAAPAAAPPAAPAPATPPTVPIPRPARGYGKPGGLLAGVLIGPKVNLVTLPSPGVGIEARVAGTFTLSIDYGLIPTTRLSNVDASYRDLSGAVRWAPWHASFHLGAALGARTFKAKVTDSTTGESARAEVSSVYLAPELGWRWIWSSGFFLGLDLGYQIILSDHTTLDLPAAVSAGDRQDVQNAANDIGKLGLPIVSLLQVGWYF